MEIKWGNVFLALIIVFSLINLPTITNNVASTISSIVGAFGSAFGSNTYNSNSQVVELAKLCVLLIFVVGILRLFKNRKR